MIAVRIVAAALALLLAVPAFAQYPGGDHRCFDDHYSGRCRMLRVRMQRELYDLPPIEQLQRGDAQVRRAFYVMGGHPANIGALTFSRHSGRPPRVEFRTPRRGGRIRMVSAEVPEEVWRDVLERSAGFERIVGGRDPDEICMHPSFYNVEAADPPAQGQPGAVAVRQDSICPVTRATEVAFHLAGVALRHIPRCAPLREAIDITFSALALCTRLPSAAAAEAYAVLVVLLQWGNDDEAGVRAAFAETVVVDWAGARLEGREAAAVRWLEEIAEAGGLLIWDGIEARGDTARVTGHVRYTRIHEDGETRHRVYRARMTVELARGADRRFRIIRARVGRFAHYTDE